jgi:hypothetical protein
LFLLLSYPAFSQSSLSEHTADIISKNGISITTSVQACEDVKNGISKEYILLSVSNENDYPVNLSFKKNLWVNGKCKSCNSTNQEDTVSITIEANGKAQGSCDQSNGLRIFSQMLNLEKVSKLTRYELVDIEVNEVK